MKIFKTSFLISALILSLLPNIFGAESASAAACTPTATRSGNYIYFAFKTVGTCQWNVPTGVSQVDLLTIGGGGGGAARHAGGGGAGGFVRNDAVSVSNVSALQIVVGNGGGGGAGCCTLPLIGGTGGSGVVLIRTPNYFAVSLTSSGTLQKTTKNLNATTLTATTTSTGTVTFYANGRVINGCKNVAVSGTTATCLWPPLTHGQQSISATYTSTDSTTTPVYPEFFRQITGSVEVVNLILN